MRELQGVEVVNAGEQPGFEEELAKDMLEIITVFSARLYGARSHKSRKLLVILTDADVKSAAKELSECYGLTALDPNDKQATVLAQHAGYARVAWTRPGRTPASSGATGS